MKKPLLNLTLIFAFVMCTLILPCKINTASVRAEGMWLEYDGDVHEYTGAVYSLIVNNRHINPPLSPIIFNDRALVPVREIFEEVGAKVEYDAEDRSVTVYNDDTTVIMFINDNIAYIDGRKTLIPDNVVPKLISKLGGETKTMVPVRFISDNIGMPVDFDSDEGAILIASDKDYHNTIEVKKAGVTDVSYSVQGDNQIVINISTNSAVEHIADFTMKNPGRIVVDLNSAELLTGEGTININENGIASIRLGDNGSRVRVVVDSEYVKDYGLETLSDNRIRLTIKTNKPQATKTPVAAPAPTAKPTTSNNQGATVQPTATPVVKPDINRHIILDAGHGGTDSGAVGTINEKSILEKNLTLSITYKVKNILERNGISVTMTRTGDTLPSLTERPAQANSEGAALFVSIHINSAEAAEAHGIETFYSVENNSNAPSYGISSETLAKSLLSGMISSTGAANRGVKTANHAVTRRCYMPASLVECGFISNADEVGKMVTEEYQNKLAEGIANGIISSYEKIKFN